MLPKTIPQPTRRPGQGIRVSPLLVEAAQSDADAVFQKLETAASGLTQEEAHRRLQQYGPNVFAQESRYVKLKLLGKAMVNPLVILLLVLAAVSFLTDDYRAGTVMLLMVLLGVSLRFVQESRADAAAAKLKAMISVTATVLRDGQPKEIPLSEVVPGDVVQLAAGDMIPADLRLQTCKDLFITQSSLTGESFPVEKFEAREQTEQPVAFGTVEHLFPWHQRRKRHGPGHRRLHRSEDVSGEHVHRHRRGASRNQFRSWRPQFHLADDPVHAGDGAAGFSDQRPHQDR